MAASKEDLQKIVAEITLNPQTFELIEKLKIYGDRQILFKVLEGKLNYDLDYLKTDLASLISAMKQFETIKPAKKFEAISKELYQNPLLPVIMDLYYAMAEPFLLRKTVKQEILFTAFKLFQPQKMFIGGVGSGEILDIIKQMPMSDPARLDIHAVDISQPSIEYCKTKYPSLPFRVNFDLQDLDKIELDQGYDLAELSEVLEHVRDPQALMAKIGKSCKYVLATIPLGLDVPDHLHIFQPPQIMQLLNSAGLDPLYQTIRGGTYIRQFFYFGLLRKI